MKPDEIFDSQAVTILLKRYILRPRIPLRNLIIEKAMPLVDAAIAKSHLYTHRDDLRQECALKLIRAVPQYDPRKSTAFGYFWTVISNHLKSTNERLSRSDLSIDTDYGVAQEAEIENPVLENAEHQYFLTLISETLSKAFRSNGFQRFSKSKHQRVCICVEESIANGTFFENRGIVVTRLRRMRLGKEETQFFIDYVLVSLRSKLYHLRGTDASSPRPFGSALSKKFGDGVLPDIRA
jgi:sigma-70-like protein